MESPTSKVFAQEELQMRITPCLTYTEIQRLGGTSQNQDRAGFVPIEAWESEVQDELLDLEMEAGFGTPRSFHDTD